MDNFTSSVLTLMKGIVDLSLGMNFLPMKRSSIVDLGIVPAVRSSFMKHVMLCTLAARFLVGLVSYVQRNQARETSVHSILHFVAIVQMAAGLFSAAEIANSCEEIICYFNYNYFLCQKFRGKYVGHPWLNYCNAISSLALQA